MTEKVRIPQIRFKGFTAPWEQRKLGDVGYCKSGVGFPDKEQGVKEGIPFFKVSDMNTFGNEREMTISNNYVTQKQVERNGWKVFCDIPAIFFAKVGAAVMLNRKRLILQRFLLDNNTMAYSLNNNYWDKDFAFAMFENIDLTSLIQVGALPSYNGNQVENIIVEIPKILEQEKIGKIFQKLDNLITLHQRKYDKLVNVKKSLLEKMFPSDGEKVPKIRFKGFTDPWEQRKFENIFNYERPDAYIVKSDKYSDEYKTPVLTANKGFILGYTNETSTHNGPCIIFDDFTLDSKYVNFDFMVKSSAIKILNVKDGYILRFAYERLNSEKLENLGHARHYISVVQPTETLMPKIAEQEKISKLFTFLENSITLHQSKLEKLKNIKKSLLEKMFV